MATPILELEGTWEDLTQHAAKFVGRRLRFVVLPIDAPAVEGQALEKQPLSAKELLKLPLHERNRILEEQAKFAEALYRNNPELTDFETFEDDIYDETP
jgi:hypothetical protein